jgi:hypothetical protein
MGGRGVVVGVLLLLLTCGGAGLMVGRPPVEQFVAPGATDIEVTALGWNEWQLRYRAPAGPTPWLMTIGRQLEQQGWSSPDRGGYGALSRSYTRVSSLRLCERWEWAFLTVDPRNPQVAQIRLRVWIAIPWWQRVTKSDYS